MLNQKKHRDMAPEEQMSEKTMPKEEKALVPGSFDPITKGHMYLIDYAAKNYRQVYVTIFVNAEKNSFFSPEERLEMIRAACKGYSNVTVDYDGGMQYLYAQKHDIRVAVRGYRNSQDYEYEQIVAKFNAEHLPGFRTELIACPEEISHISSTTVRRAMEEKEDVSCFVPEQILPFLL